MQPHPRLISKGEVCRLTSLSRAQIDRLEKAGSFPKRLRISSRRVAWREDDIAEWADSRSAKADVR
jgi:prophage regulatory protein